MATQEPGNFCQSIGPPTGRGKAPGHGPAYRLSSGRGAVRTKIAEAASRGGQLSLVELKKPMAEPWTTKLKWWLQDNLPWWIKKMVGIALLVFLLLVLRDYINADFTRLNLFNPLHTHLPVSFLAGTVGATAWLLLTRR